MYYYYFCAHLASRAFTVSDFLGSVSFSRTSEDTNREEFRKIRFFPTGLDEVMGLMDLFKPRWKHANAEIRRSAVRITSDQGILAEVAEGDSEPLVRKQAIANIADESFLVRVAENDLEPSVRKAAVARMSNQEALLEIAKSDQKASVREAAAKRILDPKVRMELMHAEEERGERHPTDVGLNQGSLLQRIAAMDLDKIMKAAQENEKEAVDMILRAASGVLFRCEACGTGYRVGIDATIVIDEDTLELSKKTLRMENGRNPDMVAPLGKACENHLREVRTMTLERLRYIARQRNQGQTRKWFCGSCGQEAGVYDYPDL